MSLLSCLAVLGDSIPTCFFHYYKKKISDFAGNKIAAFKFFFFLFFFIRSRLMEKQSDGGYELIVGAMGATVGHNK